MADIPRLRVPDPHVKPLRQLAELSDDRVEALTALLREAPPIADRGELTRRVQDAVPELTEATDLIDALLAIDTLATSHGWPAEQAAEGVSRATELELEPPARERFAERLKTMLHLPAVAMSAKALDVMTAHERFLHISRVVTDMRPIFGESVEGPSSAIISHSLELTYYRASGRIDR